MSAQTLLVLKCSEELGDGTSGTVFPCDPDGAAALLGAITTWLSPDLDEGQHFTVEVVRMTRAAYEALPEI